MKESAWQGPESGNKDILSPESCYEQAKSAMNAADNEGAYQNAANLFESIPQYRDAKALAAQCRDEALNCRFELAHRIMQSANTEEDCLRAAAIFDSIPRIDGSGERAEHCRVMSEACRKDAIYARANAMTASAADENCWMEALRTFRSIPGWKDADEQADLCA